MDILLGLLLGLLDRLHIIAKSRSHVAVEAKHVFEDGGGTSNVGATVWNVWNDIYVKLCVTNTGAPTTIKDVYISVRDGRNEVLSFSQWKVLKHINYKLASKSPELDKVLIGARIDTNDCWGPDIVLFTASKIIREKSPKLPEGEHYIVVETVGQKPVSVKL